MVDLVNLGYFGLGLNRHYRVTIKEAGIRDYDVCPDGKAGKIVTAHFVINYRFVAYIGYGFVDYQIILVDTDLGSHTIDIQCRCCCGDGE